MTLFYLSSSSHHHLKIMESYPPESAVSSLRSKFIFRKTNKGKIVEPVTMLILIIVKVLIGNILTVTKSRLITDSYSLDLEV